MSIGLFCSLFWSSSCLEDLVGFGAADSMGPAITAVVDWALCCHSFDPSFAWQELKQVDNPELHGK
jgi:hypothetical protein